LGGAACGGGTAPTPQTPAASASVSASAVASSVVAPDGGHVAQRLEDATAGTGPCRCSWEGNASAASRVCRVGETSWQGNICRPGDRSYNGDRYRYPAVGPLAPPDLPLA
jgi:hypothetical protein